MQSGRVPHGTHFQEPLRSSQAVLVSRMMVLCWCRLKLPTPSARYKEKGKFPTSFRISRIFSPKTAIHVEYWLHCKISDDPVMTVWACHLQLTTVFSRKFKHVFECILLCGILWCKWWCIWGTLTNKSQISVLSLSINTHFSSNAQEDCNTDLLPTSRQICSEITIQ